MGSVQYFSIDNLQHLSHVPTWACTTTQRWSKDRNEACKVQWTFEHISQDLACRVFWLSACRCASQGFQWAKEELPTIPSHSHHVSEQTCVQVLLHLPSVFIVMPPYRNLFSIKRISIFSRIWRGRKQHEAPSALLMRQIYYNTGSDRNLHMHAIQPSSVGLFLSRHVVSELKTRFF